MATNGAQQSTEKAAGKDKNAQEVNDVPYDRGYAWVVVFASAMIMTILSGTMKAGSIFFVEIQNVFGASRANTALIFGIYSLVTMLTSLPARLLVERFGTRNVTMVGALFMALGNILSAFAPGFYFLYFSIGLCGGFGVALTFSPTLVLVCSYFKKYRSVANALTVSGNSMGGLLMPPTANSLIDRFDLRGSFLLTGGVSMHGVLFAALMLPLEFWTPSLYRSAFPCKWPCKRSLRKQIRQNAALDQHSDSNDELESQAHSELTWQRSLLHVSDGHVMVLAPQHQTLADLDELQLKAKHISHLAWRSESDLRRRSIQVLPDSKWPLANVGEATKKHRSLSVTPECTYFHSRRTSRFEPSKLSSSSVQEQAEETEEEEVVHVVETDDPEPELTSRRIIGQLLRNPLYVTLAVCHAFFVESFKALMVCIPAHIVSLGYTRSQAVHFLTCLYLSDLAGRLASIGVSILIERIRSQWFTKRLAYVIYVHCYALAVVAFALADSDRTLLFISLAFLGLFSGLGVANHAVVLAENCKVPLEQLGMAHSLAMLFQSVSIVIMSYALGLLADAMYTWKWSLLISGLLSHFGAFVANADIYCRLVKYLFCRSRRSSSASAHIDSILSDGECSLRSH